MTTENIKDIEYMNNKELKHYAKGQYKSMYGCMKQIRTFIREHEYTTAIKEYKELVNKIYDSEVEPVEKINRILLIHKIVLYAYDEPTLLRALSDEKKLLQKAIRTHSTLSAFTRDAVYGIHRKMSRVQLIPDN